MQVIFLSKVLVSIKDKKLRIVLFMTFWWNFVRYFSKSDFPSDNFPIGNFPNVISQWLLGLLRRARLKLGRALWLEQGKGTESYGWQTWKSWEVAAWEKTFGKGPNIFKIVYDNLWITLWIEVALCWNMLWKVIGFLRFSVKLSG